MENYKSCKLCPRLCGVNRLSGEIGYCGETAELRIGVALLHNGEEPPLVGQNGSGTIFISGCNLGCPLCQNYQISQGEGNCKSLGRAVSADEFADICKALRDKGAENINIVTGSHAIPAIVEGLTAAKNAGIRLPVLWNSSAYETVPALELLKDHVDVYLPDLKTLNNNISAGFYGCRDYPQTAAAAIFKMVEMINAAYDINPDTVPEKKVIIRHLVLPGFLESTRSVLRWFAENVMCRAPGRVMLSLMTQYTPIPRSKEVLSKMSIKMPNRFLQQVEYDTVMCWLDEFGIEDGYCQELVTGSDWLPDFKLSNPFSSKLSVPIWHYSVNP